MYRFLFIVFLSINTLSSQKEYKDTLVLKDGSEFIGKLRLKNEKISLISNENGEIKSYKKELVKSFTLFNKYSKVRSKYYYKKAGKRNRIYRLKKLAEGKVEYFLHEVRDINYGVEYKTYYIGRENEDFVTKIKYGPGFKRFKVIITSFFPDCKEIITKWEEGFFGKEITDVKAIVEYYNQKCY